MRPLGLQAAKAEAGIDFRSQFRFECRLAYEIVPSGQGTYEIHVPTEKMLAPIDRVCPPPTCPIKSPPYVLPDLGPASEQIERLARTFCAKAQKSVVITGEGLGFEFDMGPGLTLTFKCVPPK